MYGTLKETPNFENWNYRGKQMVLQLIQKMDTISAFRYHLPGKTN